VRRSWTIKQRRSGRCVEASPQPSGALAGVRVGALTSFCMVIALIAMICACRHDAPRAVSTSAPTIASNPQERCAACHQAETAEWNASLHHAAYTDTDFQASFKAEPLAFCFDCHAPEAKGNRDDEQAAAIGVGCASCHSVGEGHGTRPTHVATTDCSSCHEFSFPGRKNALMQSTMTEHAKSPLADRSCASCHLPRAADGHRDHRFNVSRNEALLRSSLDVEISRRTAEGIELTLKTNDVGHAMPTGDLFRRLRIVVFAESRDGRLLGDDEILLGRRFDRAHGVPTETNDDRVFGERRVHIDGAWIANASHISIEVRYDRVGQTMEIGEAHEGHQARREGLFASVVLAQISLDDSDMKPEQRKAMR
jgi:hypothetical protein